MTPTRVSVVIPVRDDAAALRTCLEHLARQRRPPWEVVVVDNGSRDDSAAVAEQFGARVVPEPRAGIPRAAAAGYDAARGELIARCDADSRPPPGWLARLGDRLDGDPGLAAVTGWGAFYDLPRALRWPAEVGYLGAYYLLTHLALGHTALWGSNMGLRRSVWLEVRDAVHLEDPEIHDDMDLSFVVGPGRRIRFDPALRVGVSARSLRGRAQRRRRMQRARRTLELNWAVRPPWQRWQQRLSRGRLTSRG